MRVLSQKETGQVSGGTLCLIGGLLSFLFGGRSSGRCAPAQAQAPSCAPAPAPRGRC